jgi:VTC domain-containing protein
MMLCRYFQDAPAELAQRRELLQRIDSKYVMRASRIGDLLGELAGRYAVLPIPGGHVATYRSLYFDTHDLRCFHDHRRGRRIRHKVRVRHYPDRALTFLEVKSKRSRTLTDKHRVELPYGELKPRAEDQAFLRARLAFADELSPQVWVEYRRIGLVALASDERVTIDLDVEVVAMNSARTPLDDLAIVEVKQSASAGDSQVLAALARMRIRPRSLSKYTVAIALTRPHVPCNRFLPQLRALTRRFQ